MDRKDPRAGPPDEDAYERVTNPERFIPLHPAAEAIVARLESRYEVERIDLDDVVEDGVVRQVQLLPSAGAPLTIRWTTFPGLHVRYGRWHDESFPLNFSFELENGGTWGKTLLPEGHPPFPENGDLTWPAWRLRNTDDNHGPLHSA
jgi:hypothetical protein